MIWVVYHRHIQCLLSSYCSGPRVAWVPGDIPLSNGRPDNRPETSHKSWFSSVSILKWTSSCAREKKKMLKKWGRVRVQAPCLTERREATKSTHSLSRSSIPVEVRQTSSSNNPNGILKFVSAMKLYLYRVCWVSKYLWMLSRCAVIHAWLQGTWGRRDSASLPHTASLVTVSQLSAGQGCSGRF